MQHAEIKRNKPKRGVDALARFFLFFRQGAHALNSEPRHDL
jgi:hypothetical protein